jgi:type VI protein secretion system component VasK
VTFILAIIAQTVALIWFVATLRNDVDANKERMIRNETRVETLETVVQDQAVMLARIDENLKAIREAIERNDKTR